MYVLLSPFHQLGSLHLLPCQHPPSHIASMSLKTPLEGPASRQSTPVPLAVRSVFPVVPIPSSPSNMPLLQQATPPTKVEVQSTTVPRTTAWRQGKRTAAVAKLPCVRRQYTCTVCREPMTSPGHSQFYGKRYCPNAPGQIPKEEWLAQRRAEKSEKSS